MKKLFRKKEVPTASVEPGLQPENGEGEPRPIPDETDLGAVADEATADNGAVVIGEDGQPRTKKGLLKRFESNLRRRVDGYVDNKAGALLDDATRRAQDFRQETLDAVREQAMELLDLSEQRIDEKLVEIEHMLEERLRAELKMRLRALVWTLAFVLLMALISLGYVWFKQQSGLHPSEASASEREA